MGRKYGPAAGKGLVYYSGYNDGTYPTRKDGKITDEHTIWRGMLRRCYGNKGQPFDDAYTECSVSDNFKLFTYFHEWCQDQVGFGNRDHKGVMWNLDKDILFEGGTKQYNEQHCIFIPQWLNATLINTKDRRGEFPVGVHYCNKRSKFIAQINKRSRHTGLGAFSNQHDAFLAYKYAKETYLKEVAEQLYGTIDVRLFNRLYNYEVNICD